MSFVFIDIMPLSESESESETQLLLSKYLEEAKHSISKDEASNKWKDDIDKCMSKEETGEQVEPNVSSTASRDHYYGRVPQHHFPPVKIVMKDPIFENPNSFESIIQIFRAIQEKNKCREWIIIYSDGVPFLLGEKYNFLQIINDNVKCIIPGEKVILWSFVCNQCGDKIFKEAAWTKHCKLKHSNLAPSRRLEFDNLWLMPGGGHIFMQMLKGEFCKHIKNETAMI